MNLTIDYTRPIREGQQLPRSCLRICVAVETPLSDSACRNLASGRGDGGLHVTELIGDRPPQASCPSRGEATAGDGTRALCARRTGRIIPRR